jgi:uncharacterized OB-fold protein
MNEATVYTETVVYSAPAEYVNDAPYQIAIVVRPDGKRTTVRIDGPRVQIGDSVDFIETRNGVPFYRLSAK